MHLESHVSQKFRISPFKIHSMSQEKEEMSRKQSRLASLAKEHDTTKQILIGTKRKIIIRTLKQKLDESKKTNKQLRSSNLTLMTSNIYIE